MDNDTCSRVLTDMGALLFEPLLKIHHAFLAVFGAPKQCYNREFMPI